MSLHLHSNDNSRCLTRAAGLRAARCCAYSVTDLQLIRGQAGPALHSFAQLCDALNGLPAFRCSELCHMSATRLLCIRLQRSDTAFALAVEDVQLVVERLMRTNEMIGSFYGTAAGRFCSLTDARSYGVE